MEAFMSDGKAVAVGSYADFKIVKTRSVFQAIIEGPIEEAGAFVALFGVPQPGQEIHVAVARLNAIPAPAGPPPGERFASGLGGRTTGAEPGREAHDGPVSRSAARPWDTIPRSQQAGIKCSDLSFQKWLDTIETPSAVIEFANAKWPNDANKWYGALVHHHCRVSSRAEFSNKNNPAAGDRWDRFLARYDEQANRTAEQRG